MGISENKNEINCYHNQTKTAVINAVEQNIR